MTREMVMQDVRKNIFEWKGVVFGLVLGVFTACGFMFLRAAFRHAGPQATIYRDADIALINGQVAWVHLVINRKSPVCAGAKVIRQAVTYHNDNPSLGVSKVAYFSETEPNVTEPGHYDFWAEYHLRSPLVGTGWHYVSKSYDGCGITGADFDGAPLTPEPTPIKMVAAPPVLVSP